MRFRHTLPSKTEPRSERRVAFLAVALATGFVTACSMPGGGLSNNAAPLTTASTNSSTIQAPHLESFVGERAWPSLRSAMITALHGSEDGERVMWKSSRAGVTGTVTPITTVTSGDGRRCRRIAITAATEDDADEVLSEACPVGVTGWQISPL